MWTSGGSDFLNGVSILLQNTYGVSQKNWNRSALMITEDKVLYPCGKHLINYDLISNQQTIIMKNLEDEDLNNFNYMITKKSNIKIVVGLQSNNQILPQAKIYQSNKSFAQTLTHVNVGLGSQIIDVLFLFRGKYLLTLVVNAEKQNIISLWQIKKEYLRTSQILEDTYFKIVHRIGAQDEFILLGPKKITQLTYSSEKNEFQEEEVIPEGRIPDKYQDNQLLDSCFMPGTQFSAILAYGNFVHLNFGNEYRSTFQIKLSKTEDEMAEERNSQLKEQRNILSFNAFQYEKNSEESGSSKKEIFISSEYSNYMATCISPLGNGLAVGISGDIVAIVILQVNKTTQTLYYRTIFKVKSPLSIQITSISPSRDLNAVVFSVLHQQQTITNIVDKNFGTTPRASVNEENTDDSAKNQKSDFICGIEIDNLFKDPISISHLVKGRLDLFTLNVNALQLESISPKDPIQPIFEHGVHQSTIVAIGMCPLRPIFATLSQDQFIQIWQFNQKSGQFAVMQSYFFHENPLAVSIHPFGLQLAIGFQEGLKIFYLLEDELKVAISDPVKACGAVCYSNGGHFLAAGYYNGINIYNPYKLEVTINLPPAHSGLIKYLKWTSDDSLLKSSCQGGNLYTWNIHKGSRIMEHNLKSKYNMVIYDENHDITVGPCFDNTVQFFNQKGSTHAYDLETVPQNFTSVLIIHEMNVIFFGTSSGSIRMYLWPMNFQHQAQEYMQVPAHQNSVSVLSNTLDFQYLISGSEDGSILISRINEIINGKENDGSNETFSNAYQLIEANLYTIQPLCMYSAFNSDQKKDATKQLEFKIQNMSSDIQQEKQKLIEGRNIRVRTQAEKNQDSILKSKEQLSLMMEEDELRIMDINKEIRKHREIHKRNLEELEEKNNSQLLSCYDKSDKLKLELEKIQDTCQRQSDSNKAQQDKNQYTVQAQYNSQIEELESRYQSALQNANLDQKKFEEVLGQNEEEFQEFLNQSQNQLITILDIEKQKSEDFRASNTQQQKDIERFTQRQMELDSLIKETINQIDHLEEEKKSFEQKNHLMKQLKNKEEIINDQQEEIKEFRTKNQHLQNFRKVYDYRVQTLLEEQNPLNEHLAHMEVNVKVMYKQLLDEASAAQQLSENLTQSKEKYQHLQKVLQKKNDLLFVTKRKVDCFENDTVTMIQTQDFANWFNTMQKIYQGYFEGSNNFANKIEKSTQLGSEIQNNDNSNQIAKIFNEGGSAPIKEELIRNRDFLSKKIETLSRLNKQTENDRDDVIVRVQNENTYLIRQCNILREERKGLKEHLQSLQKSLQSLIREIARLEIGEQPIEDESVVEDRYLSMGDQSLKNEQSLLNKLDEQNGLAPVKKIKFNKPSNQTPFQRYQDEKEKQKLIHSSSLPRVSDINKVGKIENTKLLASLMQDIEQFNSDIDDNFSPNYDKLRDQVQTYIMTNEDQSISIPHISKNGANSIQETRIPVGVSIITDNSALNITTDRKKGSIPDNSNSQIKLQQHNPSGVQRFQDNHKREVSRSASNLPSIQTVQYNISKQ